MSTEPEPTIGQLVDAMHAEIERICGEKTWAIQTVHIDSFVLAGEHQIAVKFDGRSCIARHEPTLRQALTAIIQTLKTL